MKVCCENPNLIKISDNVHKFLAVFYCCRRHYIVMKALLSRERVKFIRREEDAQTYVISSLYFCIQITRRERQEF